MWLAPSFLLDLTVWLFIIPGLHETILIDENPKFRGCQGVK